MAMEISNAYSRYTSVYTSVTNSKKQTSESKETAKTSGTDGTSETKTETAKKSTSEYLSELNEKYSGLNIMSGSANKNYNSGNYPNKIDVMIHPSILKKMASDSQEAAKYEKMLADIPQSDKWFRSMAKAMTGDKIYYRQVWIDEDGNMGSFSIGGPSEKQKKADQKRKEEEHEAFEKRLEKAKEKSKEKRKQLEELLRGDKESLPNIDTSADIDTSDLMKLISIDIKA